MLEVEAVRFSLRSTSTPSRPGMSMSRMIKLGWALSAVAIPVCPSLAINTSYPASCKTWEYFFWRTLLSSMYRIVSIAIKPLLNPTRSASECYSRILRAIRSELRDASHSTKLLEDSAERGLTRTDEDVYSHAIRWIQA